MNRNSHIISRIERGLPLNHRGDLLNRSVTLIQTTLSGNGRLRINRVIKCQVNRLTEEFDYEFDEVVNCQVETILNNNLHGKYKPERALSTFITHTANYGLKHWTKFPPPCKSRRAPSP